MASVPAPPQPHRELPWEQNRAPRELGISPGRVNNRATSSPKGGYIWKKKNPTKHQKPRLLLLFYSDIPAFPGSELFCLIAPFDLLLKGGDSSLLSICQIIPYVPGEIKVPADTQGAEYLHSVFLTTRFKIAEFNYAKEEDNTVDSRAPST